MKKKVLRQVADYIEANGTRYDHSNLNFCAIGLAREFLERNDMDAKNWLSCMQTSLQLLGLTEGQHNAIFAPFGAVYERKGPVDAKRTAATLRHLAATGQIDWSL